ncbi:hypothetical protein BpHYR1_019305 [Brachionus plicatilis]|uniref:Uncharacterized protein n=1 Tax=Brachionus plicatilis TaxID=10195 RepID=A0A3M7RHH6_BRAPC|nr:hypothetical protein BpHYR1_019305 [Brachionus plicatilis]
MITLIYIQKKHNIFSMLVLRILSQKLGPAFKKKHFVNLVVTIRYQTTVYNDYCNSQLIIVYIKNFTIH